MRLRTLPDLAAKSTGVCRRPADVHWNELGTRFVNFGARGWEGARPANGRQDALNRKGIVSAAHRHTPDAMHDLVTTTTWLKSLCRTPEGDPQTVGMRLTQFREDPAHKPPDNVLALPPAAARRAPHPATPIEIAMSGY